MLDFNMCISTLSFATYIVNIFFCDICRHQKYISLICHRLKTFEYSLPRKNCSKRPSYTIYIDIGRIFPSLPLLLQQGNRNSIVNKLNLVSFWRYLLPHWWFVFAQISSKQLQSSMCSTEKKFIIMIVYEYQIFIFSQI